jgi:glycosyltransferase involved in cell wall biosynthesis
MVDARLGLGSGIGRYVLNIVPRVAIRLNEVAFDLVVDPHEAGRIGDVMSARARNVTVCPDPTPPFSLREQASFAVRARRFDATWFVNYWMPLRWRGPTLVVVHDLLHLAPDLFPGGRLKRLLARATFEKVRRSADEVIFISRFTEREFRDRVGTPEGRTTVVHHGVDHFRDHVGIDRPATVPVKQPQMIVVAAAKRHKNFAVVLDAWQRSALPDPWKLIVVTPGDALRSSVSLDSAAAAANAGVEIRRGIDDAALWNLYEQSAVLLMPSLYEGFGLPLLEGMMHGCVPIASTADALVEVGAGSCIAHVPGHDVEGWAAAMRAVAQRIDLDPAWLAATGRRNAAHAQAWQWDDAADKTAAILARMLSGVASPTNEYVRGRS